MHIDLSPCEHWVRLMEVWYHRNQTSRGEECDYDEVTIVFMPDLWITNEAKKVEEVKKEEPVEKKEEEEKEEEEEEESRLTPETLGILRIADLRALLQQRGMTTTVGV